MRVPNPPAQPLLVYDGDCGFCRTWIARWRRTIGDRVTFEAYQTACARFPVIERSRFRRAVQLILPDGEVFEGAEAVFRTLALSAHHPRQRRWLAIYQNVPGARPVFEWGYRWVAQHRPLLSRSARYFLGPPRETLAAAGSSGEIDPALARELAAARRRRIGVAAGMGALLLLGGVAAWRRRSRRRQWSADDQSEK